MKQLAKYGSLQGKRVFITGGGSGIGESLVAEFAAQGALVAFVDIAVEASEALCRRLAEAGLAAPLFRHCDITDIASLQAVMAELAQKLGDFDILVNNAANDQRHQAQDVTLEYWNERIAINQRPMFFTCQAVFEGMKRQGGGSIINVSSISWHMKSGGYPVYATTKAAVVGLTRGLARDYGAHNIRVNTVTPGWVMTQRQIDLVPEHISPRMQPHPFPVPRHRHIGQMPVHRARGQHPGLVHGGPLRLVDRGRIPIVDRVIHPQVHHDGLASAFAFRTV